MSLPCVCTLCQAQRTQTGQRGRTIGASMQAPGWMDDKIQKSLWPCDPERHSADNTIMDRIMAMCASFARPRLHRDLSGVLVGVGGIDRSMARIRELQARSNRETPERLGDDRGVVLDDCGPDDVPVSARALFMRWFDAQGTRSQNLDAQGVTAAEAWERMPPEPTSPCAPRSCASYWEHLSRHAVSDTSPPLRLTPDGASISTVDLFRRATGGSTEARDRRLYAQIMSGLERAGTWHFAKKWAGSGAPQRVVDVDRVGPFLRDVSVLLGDTTERDRVDAYQRGPDCARLFRAAAEPSVLRDNATNAPFVGDACSARVALPSVRDAAPHTAREPLAVTESPAPVHCSATTLDKIWTVACTSGRDSTESRAIVNGPPLPAGQAVAVAEQAWFPQSAQHGTRSLASNGPPAVDSAARVAEQNPSCDTPSAPGEPTVPQAKQDDGRRFCFMLSEDDPLDDAYGSDDQGECETDNAAMPVAPEVLREPDRAHPPDGTKDAQPPNPGRHCDSPLPVATQRGNVAPSTTSGSGLDGPQTTTPARLHQQVEAMPEEQVGDDPSRHLAERDRPTAAPRVSDWSTDDVGDWVATCDGGRLAMYRRAFATGGIRGRHLQYLATRDLADCVGFLKHMGINCPADAMVLHQLIVDLVASAPRSSSPAASAETEAEIPTRPKTKKRPRTTGEKSASLPRASVPKKTDGVSKKAPPKCARCGAAPAPGHTLCEPHRLAQNARQRDYDRKKARSKRQRAAGCQEAPKRGGAGDVGHTRKGRAMRPRHDKQRLRQPRSTLKSTDVAIGAVVPDPNIALATGVADDIGTPAGDEFANRSGGDRDDHQHDHTTSAQEIYIPTPSDDHNAHTDSPATDIAVAPTVKTVNAPPSSDACVVDRMPAEARDQASSVERGPPTKRKRSGQEDADDEGTETEDEWTNVQSGPSSPIEIDYPPMTARDLLALSPKRRRTMGHHVTQDNGEGESDGDARGSDGDGTEDDGPDHWYVRRNAQN